MASSIYFGSWQSYLELTAKPHSKAISALLGSYFTNTNAKVVEHTVEHALECGLALGSYFPPKGELTPAKHPIRGGAAKMKCPDNIHVLYASSSSPLWLYQNTGSCPPVCRLTLAP